MAKGFFYVALVLIIAGIGLWLIRKGKSDADRLGDEALRSSGINNKLSQIPLLMRNQLIEEQWRLSAKQFELVSKIVDESFQVGTLKSLVKAKVMKDLDRERLSAVLKGLRSQPVSKMVQLETQAARPEAFLEAALFNVKAQQTPPSSQRTALLERLDTATGATEMAVEIPVAMVQGMAKIIDAALPPAKRSNRKELDEVVNLMRTRHRQDTHRNTQLSLLYAYRSISDGALQQDVELLEREPTKSFNAIANKGVLEVFSNLSEEAARRVAKTVMAEKDKDSP